MEIIEPDHTTKIQAQQDADNKLPSTIDQQYFLTFFNTNNVENVTSSSFEGRSNSNIFCWIIYNSLSMHFDALLSFEILFYFIYCLLLSRLDTKISSYG